jgi:hypothetical protein
MEPDSIERAYDLVIVAFVPATGLPDIATVEASDIVLAETKAYVGAEILIALWVVKAPAANCTVLARFR